MHLINGLVVSGAPDAIKVWDITSARCLQTFSTARMLLHISALPTVVDTSYLDPKISRSIIFGI